MESEKLRQFKCQSPFVPFRIQMSDGAVYFVDNPDFFSVSRSGSTLVFCTQDDRLAIIDCAEIESIAGRDSAQ